MKRLLLAAACAALLPGCLASVGVQAGNTGAPATAPSVGPGASFSTTSVNARVSNGATLGALAGMAVLGAVLGGEAAAGEPGRAPELDTTRMVHEQDCTRAPERPEANLRCK